MQNITANSSHSRPSWSYLCRSWICTGLSFRRVNNPAALRSCLVYTDSLGSLLCTLSGLVQNHEAMSQPDCKGDTLAGMNTQHAHHSSHSSSECRSSRVPVAWSWSGGQVQSCYQKIQLVTSASYPKAVSEDSTEIKALLPQGTACCTRIAHCIKLNC